MFYKSPSLLPPDTLSMIRVKSEITKLITGLLRRLVERSVSFGLTRLLRIPDIYRNYTYANAVLTWMIEKMANTDPEAFGTLHNAAPQLERTDEGIPSEPTVSNSEGIPS
ncbi:hypothetical protein M758_10G119900 [Ceratodon purpureus]|uniref:Uncharacterized protein n=1 Tax=Ceratodon purpureus TaxID=3225 RepID=A0A8T0GN84_CERPU|nr:hypothetical protein KC19_10G124300 [Ceratodon purpureus]KAG0603776.1 hypothetical protein M758_10G119900 [Ceratodon purpureus]